MTCAIFTSSTGRRWINALPLFRLGNNEKGVSVYDTPFFRFFYGSGLQTRIYVKATNIEAIKLPAPCNRIPGIIEPLKIFSFSPPNNKAPVPVNTNVNI